VALNSFQTSGSSPTDRDARCHVAILGFGTVGSAVARRLTGPDAPSPLRLTHICDRRAREKRARQSGALLDVAWTDRFDEVLAGDVDVVVDTLASGEPALEYARAALLAGKSVVTSNKLVIAHHGPAMLLLAERQGRQLRFGAAVGGSMPLVRTMWDGLSGDRILEVDAILNATSNAVLSLMDDTECPMDEAIADACANGYAEADPSVDLDGHDAAAKLAIVCALAFGVRVLPDAIETRTTARIGLDELRRARLRGGTIRQIAHAAYDRASGVLTAWVAPTFVTADSLFAAAKGPRNVAVIRCAHAGEITLSGAGAGGDATAAAILSDVQAIARDRAALVPAPIVVAPRDIAGLSDNTFAEAV
jgi:homoserine dehydrogenase